MKKREVDHSLLDKAKINKKEKLYDEKVLIKYELPSDVKVEEM